MHQSKKIRLPNSEISLPAVAVVNLGALAAARGIASTQSGM